MVKGGWGKGKGCFLPPKPQNGSFETTGPKFQGVGIDWDKKQSHRMGFLRKNGLKQALWHPSTGLSKFLIGQPVAYQNHTKNEKKSKLFWASSRGLKGSLLLHQNIGTAARFGKKKTPQSSNPIAYPSPSPMADAKAARGWAQMQSICMAGRWSTLWSPRASHHHRCPPLSLRQC